MEKWDDADAVDDDDDDDDDDDVRAQKYKDTRNSNGKKLLL